jgi:hypothetical protein
MSVINRVYFRIIINMRCIGKYVSQLSLPQYGVCVLCAVQSETKSGGV